MMRREFKWYRNLILSALAIGVAGDAALVAYSVRNDASARSPQRQLAILAEQRKILQADVLRARGIQKEMPKTKADCIAFESSLPTGDSGYAMITSEFSELAHKSGLQLGAVGFRQKELKGRSMSEISIDATVEGSYKSVVGFLNGLQRSNNYYVIEGLALAEDNSGQAPKGTVKVTVHVTSYFKASA